MYFTRFLWLHHIPLYGWTMIYLPAPIVYHILFIFVYYESEKKNAVLFFLIARGSKANIGMTKL